MSDNPVFLGFHAFLLDFFEIQTCFVDCRTKFYSSVVFSWKGGSFHCKILFFWYFSNFQRLIRLRSDSLTNTKPSRGVVCHYCYNLGHVRQNCRKLQNKNQGFHVFVQTLRSDNRHLFSRNLFSPLYYNMGFSIRPRVLIHPLRMG